MRDSKLTRAPRIFSYLLKYCLIGAFVLMVLAIIVAKRVADSLSIAEPHYWAACLDLFMGYMPWQLYAAAAVISVTVIYDLAEYWFTGRPPRRATR